MCFNTFKVRGPERQTVPLRSGLLDAGSFGQVVAHLSCYFSFTSPLPAPQATNMPRVAAPTRTVLRGLYGFPCRLPSQKVGGRMSQPHGRWATHQLSLAVQKNSSFPMVFRGWWCSGTRSAFMGFPRARGKGGQGNGSLQKHLTRRQSCHQPSPKVHSCL